MSIKKHNFKNVYLVTQAIRLIYPSPTPHPPKCISFFFRPKLSNTGLHFLPPLSSYSNGAQIPIQYSTIICPSSLNTLPSHSPSWGDREKADISQSNHPTICPGYSWTLLHPIVIALLFLSLAFKLHVLATWSSLDQFQWSSHPLTGLLILLTWENQGWR